MAGKPHEPTDATRRAVELMTACGVNARDIGAILKILPACLRRHYRAELDLGLVKANVQVGSVLYRMATSGENTAATCFWLKCRAGWREVARHELTGLDGAPLAAPAFTMNWLDTDGGPGVLQAGERPPARLPLPVLVDD